LRGLQSRFQSSGQHPPGSGPGLGPAPGLVDAGRAGPAPVQDGGGELEKIAAIFPARGFMRAV